MQKFIDQVCFILDLDIPKISYDISKFLSSTQLAGYIPGENIIYIRKTEKMLPDHYFAIAHELRHMCQWLDDKEYYFSDYKPVNQCSSIEEYNLQIAEIDAHAFAALIMEEFFGLTPQFNNLSDKVIRKIKHRMQFLLDTEF